MFDYGRRLFSYKLIDNIAANHPKPALFFAGMALRRLRVGVSEAEF